MLKGIDTCQMSYYCYVQCCNDVQIVKGKKEKCLFHDVCSSLVALFLWQQVTNIAAVIAHCGISPNRYGSLSKLDLFMNSLRVWGKYVFLIWSYIWQEVRKCSSVSTTFLNSKAMLTESLCFFLSLLHITTSSLYSTVKANYVSMLMLSLVVLYSVAAMCALRHFWLHRFFAFLCFCLAFCYQNKWSDYWSANGCDFSD